jgi:hypothetical protein
MDVQQSAQDKSSDALHKILPDGFRSVIETCTHVNASPPGYKAIIHLECKNSDECDRWIQLFGKSSFCTWRTRHTFPNGRRGLVYRKDYVCQHSDFNKSCHEKYKKTKDTSCPAKLVIKVNSKSKSFYCHARDFKSHAFCKVY